MYSIILANPQMGENIGAAARAMHNFGLTDLRLVAPRDGWPNERAYTMSSGALDHMPEVEVFDTLAEALHDLHFSFATTARPRDMVKPVFTPEQASAEALKRKTKQQQKIGIVFGAERTGLLNDQISLCSAMVSIPTNPDFSSLNLGQSVLLLSYAFMADQLGMPSKPQEGGPQSPPAPQRELHSFLDRLQTDLEDRNFFRAANLKPTMVRNIQNIFTRAEITEQELRTLHGILSALRGNKTPK